MARRPPALSPSRANDFTQCPLMFRLRVVDQLPEEPSPAAELGTLVHTVLEELFDLPAAERTPDAALAALGPAWERRKEDVPELGGLHEDAAAEAAWLVEAAARVEAYFRLENPQRLQPEAREQFVEYQLEDGPLLRGVIDRVDVAPDGSIRIVDYKTGKSPLPGYGAQAKFQMRFYALLVERLRGRAPTVLQLLYLRDGVAVTLRPTVEDLGLIEHQVRELWADISAAARQSRWAARPSKLCAWCSFQAYCPEFGGQPPAVDPDAVEAATGVRPEAG
jgi:putative RecB family exonuclease